MAGLSIEQRIPERYPKEGKCILCGSEEIEFSPAEIDEAGLTYHCTCYECGAKFDECYDLVFAGNWNIIDKNGTEYEDKET